MKFTRRKLLASIAALVGLSGGGWIGKSAASQYYYGPVSDHFDGVRFFDAHGMAPKKFTELLYWYATRSAARWPETVQLAARDTPPMRVTGDEWRISYVGHASILLQTAGLNILFDPVWSERASPFSFLGPKRHTEPGIAFDALPPIDVVLISHCHYDHLDLETLSRLATKFNPRMIVPLGNDAIIRAYDSTIRAEAFDWGARVELSARVAVTLAPARHWSARHYLDRNKALWAAFVLETPGGRLYHVGDSGYGDGHHFRQARAAFGDFKLAILPIGAYEPRWFMRDQHMNPDDALQAMRDLGARQAMAHHYGTFQLTDEAIDAPPMALHAALDKAGISRETFRVLPPGGVWTLPA